MKAAEDMTYEDMKQAIDGFVLRSCNPITVPNKPGTFNPLILPMDKMAAGDNERVPIHHRK